jgi:hypothetical protein
MQFHIKKFVHMGCRNPTLAKCGGWNPTLGKVGGLESSGFPNVQSSSTRPKKPCIGVFLVSLESSWNVDIENGLALAIRTSAAQIMGKKGLGVKLAVWLPTTKSPESTSFWRLLEECDTALKSSRRELQLWFRTHPDPSLARGAMAVQSLGSLAGTPFRESQQNVPFGCSLRDQPQRIL